MENKTYFDSTLNRIIKETQDQLSLIQAAIRTSDQIIKNIQEKYDHLVKIQNIIIGRQRILLDDQLRLKGLMVEINEFIPTVTKA